MSTASSAWIIRRRAAAGAKIRLFCFPYAGGGSLIYSAWPAALGDEVDVAAVQLPGRENRFREAPIDDVHKLCELLVGALAAELQAGPFAFFGHSCGALVAFELTRELRRRGMALPVCLLVSAAHAPARRSAGPSLPLSSLDGDALVREIDERYGGIPAELLRNREVLELFLPSLRADLRGMECYAYASEPALPMPIHSFGGRADRVVSAEGLLDWRHETDSSFSLQLFCGGHFFIQEARPAVLAALARTLLEPARQSTR